MYFPKIGDEDKFLGIEYLNHGNSRQRAAYNALLDTGVMEKLAGFSALLAGTIPIGIDVEESDLDIICDITGVEEPDYTTFVTALFSEYPGYALFKDCKDDTGAIIASFRYGGFTLEIFAQRKNTCEQNAYRHMITEYRILSSKGEGFRNEIVELKKSGVKTEPAFARLLGLDGNPYNAILSLWH